MTDAPGPAPDQAAAELAEAEQIARAYAEERRSYTGITSDDVRLVLAELDRQRARIAAVLAEVAEHERFADPRSVPALSYARIRALLEGEGR